MKFAFEDTPVYRLSMSWTQSVEKICETLRDRASAGLLDQFRRAALSIPLNFAEGYGRWHRADKQQFFRIARGSVFECVPILQLMKARSFVGEAEYKAHYECLLELANLSLDGKDEEIGVVIAPPKVYRPESFLMSERWTRSASGFSSSWFTGMPLGDAIHFAEGEVNP